MPHMPKKTGFRAIGVAANFSENIMIFFRKPFDGHFARKKGENFRPGLFIGPDWAEAGIGDSCGLLP